jgi:hypothetical protein
MLGIRLRTGRAGALIALSRFSTLFPSLQCLARVRRKTIILDAEGVVRWTSPTMATFFADIGTLTPELAHSRTSKGAVS